MCHFLRKDRKIRTGPYPVDHLAHGIPLNHRLRGRRRRRILTGATAGPANQFGYDQRKSEPVRRQTDITKRQTPRGNLSRGALCVNAGNDLLSPWTDYHRPQVLNGRVRNGNGCDHLGMITGKSHEYQNVSLATWWHEVVMTLQIAGERTMWPNVRLLVPVSSEYCYSYTPGLSTR